jgi:4-hydroxybenzoate polyprenyltransferase
MKICYYVWQSLRPKQWSKNLLVFAGILFSQNIVNLPLLFKAIFAFFVFCLLSGAVYMLNDITDVKKDRLHPVKSQRPLAAGRLRVSHAVLILIFFIAFALGLSYYLSLSFFLVALAYFLLQLAYSFSLKRIVILDVFAVAGGFVLRVVAGTVAINVEISSWLLICTIFLALFLGLSKRRHELVVLGAGAKNHRAVLSRYSPYLLDQMISVVTASTLVAYCLYTMSEETIEKFGTRNLIFTIPFVLYGIFRYLYLVHQEGEGGSPENILITDKPLLVAIVLWILTIVIVLYG